MYRTRIGRLAVLTTFLASGCSAALQERMAVDTYWTNEKFAALPHVSEHSIGIRDHFGYQKRLIVHNPLPYRVKVKLTCSSIYQNDDEIEVPGNRVRYALISGMREHDQTCFLSHWEPM